MPKVSDEHRAARRDEILTAALRCFERSGYHRTSMADIIAESGLSAGAIYGYFESKRQIIQTVGRQTFSARQAELVTRGEDHVLAPAEIVTTLVEGLRRNVSIRLFIQLWSEATVDEDLHEVLVDSLSRVRETVVGALERWARANPTEIDGDPEGWSRRVAPLLMSMIPGYALQSTFLPWFDGDDYIAAVPLVFPGASG